MGIEVKELTQGESVVAALPVSCQRLDADGRRVQQLLDDPVDREVDLATRLAETFVAVPQPPIFVKGDVLASYGRVRAVMKMCNDAGFETVGLITKDRKEGS